jgi:hypothetical protein
LFSLIPVSSLVVLFIEGATLWRGLGRDREDFLFHLGVGVLSPDDGPFL